eukprot:1162016-Pelagomonas_calceolata.AAC.19
MSLNLGVISEGPLYHRNSIIFLHVAGLKLSWPSYPLSLVYLTDSLCWVKSWPRACRGCRAGPAGGVALTGRAFALPAGGVSPARGLSAVIAKAQNARTHRGEN